MTRQLAVIFTLTLAVCTSLSGAERDDIPCDAFPGLDLHRPSQKEWNIAVQYLMWWTDGADAPPLVSTSDDGSLRSEAGVIGNPTTEILFGGDGLNRSMRNGVRLLADRRLTDEWSIYGEGFYVGDDDDQYDASSTGLPILARPYVSAQTLANDSELVAFPSMLSGQIDVQTSSQIFGFELGASTVLSENEQTRVALFGGYRFIQFEDSVFIEENLESIDPGGLVALGTTFRVNDGFDARNQFHGVNFQLDIQKRIRRWELSLQPSLGLGSIKREVSISGSTRTQIPGFGPTFVDGGLLAQPTNIGRDTSSVFTVVPEFRLFAERRIRENIALGFGYSFLLLPEAVRAAEQIDENVNQSQIGGGALVGTAAPIFQREESHIWNQSLLFSLSIQR